MCEGFVSRLKVFCWLALFLLPAVLLSWHQRVEAHWQQIEQNDPHIQSEIAEICTRMQADHAFP
jgi:hypothetical protein